MQAGDLSADDKRLSLASLACAHTGALWSNNRCLSITLPTPCLPPLSPFLGTFEGVPAYSPTRVPGS